MPFTKFGHRIRGIGEYGHPGHLWHGFLEHLQPFPAQLLPESGHSGDVPARVRKTSNKPVSDRVAGCHDNDGDRACGVLRSHGSRVDPTTITSTLSRTNSSAIGARRSTLPSAYRGSRATFFVPTYPCSRGSLLKRLDHVSCCRCARGKKNAYPHNLRRLLRLGDMEAREKSNCEEP